MNRRHFMGGTLSLTALVASGCDAPDTTDPVDPLDTGPIDVDSLTEILESLLSGSGYEDRAGPAMEAAEGFRAALAEELPGAAALLATGLNELALPLLTGLAALELDPDAAAFSAHLEAMTDGMERIQAILPTVHDEVADQSLIAGAAERDISELAASMSESHIEVREAAGDWDTPFVTPALALMNQTQRRIAAGDLQAALDDMDDLAAIGPLPAKALRLLAKDGHDENGECGVDDELKAAWYGLGWIWAIIQLVMLLGWGSTGLLGTLLIGWFTPLSIVFMIVLLFIAYKIITKAPKFIEQVQQCHCSLSAGGDE